MQRMGWFLWVIFLGIYLTRPISDPDVWWHLNIGRWIVAHDSLPVTDLWTVYGENQIFRAYSWSQEILYALAYHAWGVHGLAYLYALTSIFIAGCLCFAYGVVSRDFLTGLLLGTITMMGLVSHQSLRPQSLTWGYFALMIASSSLLRYGDKKAFLSLLILSMLWANTHLSLMLGIGGVILWVGDYRKSSIAILLMLFGSLITPYFGGEWLTFYNKLGHPTSFSSIVEFGPATLLSYPTAFLIILFTLLGVLVFETRVKIEKFHWCILLAFAALGLGIVKFLPFALIATSFVIAQVISNAQIQGHLTVGIRKLIDIIQSKVIGQGLYALILALIFVHLSRINALPVDLKSIPDLSMNYILENKLAPPITNGFKDGGYVSFRLSDENGVPSQKVSIDGRTNLIPHDLWEDYLLAVRGWQGYQKFLNRFNPNVIIWRKESALPQILTTSGEWVEVFSEGDEYVVLSKRN